MKRRKIIVIIVVILITLVVYINFIPFEQWIFRFETPEEAIKFDYTAKVKEIKAKIEIDEFAYMYYINNEGKLESKYLQKDNRGWISPIKKIILSNKSKSKFEYSITSYIENGKNLIIIKTISKNKGEIVKELLDNIETEFKSIAFENIGYYCQTWIGVIEKYPKNYYIYIDSEEIKL